MSDNSEQAPTTPEPPPLRVADRTMIEAFQRGDVPALVKAFLASSEGDARAALDQAMRFAVEIRRQNVSAIGQHEVFTRRTSVGELRQVVAPVRLSLAEGTLYQIPERMEINGTWQDVVKEPHRAQVSYQGLIRINAVAGCAVGQPATVEVDGETRTNPYRKLSPDGDIERIVVAVHVVGPSPVTGNLVAVQYTLDVDPGKDLAHMLLGYKLERVSKLMTASEWRDLPAEQRAGHAWYPLYAGVGIYHDLRNQEVVKAYKKMVQILQNALKKAITTARRNAMKAHPALGFHSLAIDANGVAVVRGVGWCVGGDDLDGYATVLDRLAAGGTTPRLEGLEVKQIAESYEPEEHVLGDPELDVVTIDAGMEARNELIARIDEGLAMLSPQDAHRLAPGYDPAGQTDEELRGLLASINSALDGEVGRD